MGIVTVIGKHCRRCLSATGAILITWLATGGNAAADCPKAYFAAVVQDGYFYDAPGGKPIGQFSANDVFDYTFEIVGCQGGWMWVLYYGDQRQRWMLADKIGPLSNWVRSNRRAVDVAIGQAAAAGASGVSGLPRLSK